VKPDATIEDALIEDTCRELHQRFGIEHATLQVERERCPGCGLAPPEVV
jgi:Co/Zn/Cd efflux system component